MTWGRQATSWLLAVRSSAAVALAAGLSSAIAAEPPDFERDVAPILVNHCLDCHQPTKRSGELNLSTLGGVLAGGEQGPALVAGKPARACWWIALTRGEMPPPDAKDAQPLSESEIDDAQRVGSTSGAAWPKDRELGIHEKTVDLDQARTFWSFQPVRRPVVPTDAATLRRAARPIRSMPSLASDFQRLASRFRRRPASGRLLRRLSLDLRGLPPTLDEQAAFLADQSPDAYERLVDRLLADPAYGERWARHWLDLVRYADSQRLRARRRQAQRLAVSRLRDRGAERRQAVRPLRRSSRSPATNCRTPATRR